MKDIKITKSGDVTFIDLTNTTFISFFDLINLYLEVDKNINKSKNTTILFNGIGPFSQQKILDIHEYKDIRRKKDERIDTIDFKAANSTYKFIAFLHHFGFIEAYRYKRGSILTFAGLSDTILKNLDIYSNIGSRILGILPILNADTASQLRLESRISSWIDNLDGNILNHPLFKDREFSRVFGYQLALNIIEHSGMEEFHDSNSLGALCIQAIEQRKFKKSICNYVGFEHLFINEYLGVIEVCVGDNGLGIFNTLNKKFDEVCLEFGIDTSEIKENQLEYAKHVIAFAFDELGSNKVKQKKIGGVHALHRILKSVAKYEGILHVKTGGYELIYDFTKNELVRDFFGLGFTPHSFSEIENHFGTQIQILIPLKNYSESIKTIPVRFDERLKIASTELKIRIVILSSYFREDAQDLTKDYESYEKSFSELNVKLNIESSDTLIVFDFSGKDWNEDEVSFILYSQKNILHTKFCVCINFPNGLPKQLRDREKLIIPLEKKEIFEGLDFVDVLSSKHRLLPVFDINNELTFLGLGKNEIDKLFEIVFKEEYESFTQEDIFSQGIPLEEIDLGQFFIKNNTQLFDFDKEKHFWKPTITKGVYQSMLEKSITTNFPKIVDNSQCILQKENKKFILPSSKKLTDKFVQAIELYQDNISAAQIGNILANAVISALGDAKKALFVTTTAPAELLSKVIEDSLSYYDTYIVNLGHFSAIKDQSLESVSDWYDTPLFIITDVIDKKNTLNEIEVYLKKKGFEIRGIITLINFTEDSPNLKPVIFHKWIDYKINQSIFPNFVFSEMRRPDSDEIKHNNFDLNSLKDIWLIEPFSLREFELTQLANVNPETVEKLKLLEENDILREGHWVYENHHFSLTTSLRKLIKNNIISFQILNELIDLIYEKEVNLIIIPLHSHIRDLIPKVITAAKIRLDLNLEYYYCVSTKVLTENSFYILPKLLEKKLKYGKENYNILILDDTIATGRTQETLLRAILRSSGKNETNIINSIHIYTIINRLGLAKNTLWESISSLSYLSSQNVEFNLYTWLSLDIPVYNEQSCPYCIERREYTYILNSLKNLNTSSLYEEFERQINRLIPHSTESPYFVEFLQKKLPLSISLGGMEAITVELVLWQLTNLISRGYPLMFTLIEIKQMFNLFLEIDNDEYNNTIEYLKCEILLILISNIKRFSDKISEQILYDLLKVQIINGSESLIRIMPKLGKKLTELRNNESKLLIEELFYYSLEYIIQLADGEIFRNESLDNIEKSISLFLIFYSQNITGIMDDELRKTEKERYDKFLNELNERSTDIEISKISKLSIKNISDISSKVHLNDKFIPALINVLENTIRSSNTGNSSGNHSHQYLIPVLMKKIVQRQPLDESLKRLINDTLYNHLFNFDIIEQKYPMLFNEHSQIALNSHKKLIKKLLYLSKNNENWTNQVPNEKLISAARNILNTSIHLAANPLYSSFKETHMKLSTLISYIENICVKRNIVFENTIIKSEIALLVPSFTNHKNSIFSQLDNYLANLISDVDKPRIKLTLDNDKKNGYSVTLINIYTYLAPYEHAKNLINTHGNTVVNLGYTRLFGIKTLVNPIKERGFTACILFRFYNGFKLRD